MLLTGSADQCNVFWQIGTSATLGTDSHLVGTVMAHDSITATTGTSVSGRLLARDAAVTLDTNVVTMSACTAAVTTTTSHGSGGGGGGGGTTSTTTSPTTTSSTTSTTSATTTSTSTTVPAVVAAVPTTIGTAQGGPVTPTTLVGGGTFTPATTVPAGSSTMLPRTGTGVTRTGLAGALAVLCGLVLVRWSRRELAYVPCH
jgi:hypothetical protein